MAVVAAGIAFLGVWKSTHNAAGIAEKARTNEEAIAGSKLAFDERAAALERAWDRFEWLTKQNGLPLPVRSQIAHSLLADLTNRNDPALVRMITRYNAHIVRAAQIGPDETPQGRRE